MVTNFGAVALKTIRNQVEEYEKLVKKQAKRLERTRRNSEGWNNCGKKSAS
jgi:hypothetical protein